MEDRLGRWYRNSDAKEESDAKQRRTFIAGLVNKTNMFSFAQKHNIPLPHRYAETKSVKDIDFNQIPERVVVKPNNSADSDCVMLFAGGKEIFSGSLVAPEERSCFIEKTFQDGRFLNSYTKILVEEFIQDYDDRFLIPRDFKVYVAGGQAHIIQVIDRNGPKKAWSHSFYDRNWNEIQDRVQETYARGSRISAPERLSELISLSERMAKEINCFMRLDFFISPDRVVFGEFTSYPFAGRHYTQWGDDLMCRLMDQYPDPF